MKGFGTEIETSKDKGHEGERVNIDGRKTMDAKDGERLSKGLAQLVLQLVNLIRELMERQAIRRMPSLPLEKQEELGLNLMLLREKLEELTAFFGLKEEDLELGLIGSLEDLMTKSLLSIAREE